ncbi:MAG: 30S ribosomal protein S20 [Gemmatimonadetes bacterium]|nr:30S ribosomal protein S20 [Gemmatimonadota bacterium]
MPHHRSAVKRLRQSAVARQRNRNIKSTIKTAVKKLDALTDPTEARALLSEVHGMLDKAAKRNVMHARTADRRKSRLAKRIAALGD